jgi:pantoate--beta-alanine ligase
LIRNARQNCDILIVSIFVNPTQFNDKSDLAAYPRDLTSDASALAPFDVDFIFAPDEKEIYPEGFSTYVYVEGLSDILEGAFRPGHFRGVATVVTILFNSIRPDIAFFGQKDAQQVAVIKRLVADLSFETEIVVVPTVREKSGLALSSRNERLSPEEREKAAVIFRGLSAAQEEFKKGTKSGAELTRIARSIIEAEPLAKIDYVEVVNAQTFELIEVIGDDEALVVAAVNFGNVRLIDNVSLSSQKTFAD